MLTKTDIEKILNGCCKAGKNGLGNGNKAEPDDLKVDFLSPPLDFLGTGNNPAIFVNQHTYKLLGRHHKSWEVNKTIAVKESFLSNAVMTVIGILIHEAGHAFNVAANIENSEANAYIFEIEIIALWFKTRNPLLYDCSQRDLQSFLDSRLPYYRKEIRHCKYLETLVGKIELGTLLEQAETSVVSVEMAPVSTSGRFVVPTPTKKLNTGVFFKPLTSDLTEQQTTLAIVSIEF